MMNMRMRYAQDVYEKREEDVDMGEVGKGMGIIESSCR